MSKWPQGQNRDHPHTDMGSGDILPIRESHPWSFFFRRPPALISEPSALISTLTYMPIKVDILDSGTHLERSAAKNYANPRYKCAEISDMDPIGDQNHNQGNPQFRSHPNPLNRYSRTLVREENRQAKL